MLIRQPHKLHILPHMIIFLFFFSGNITLMLLDGMKKLQTHTKLGLKLQYIDGTILDFKRLKLL